MTEQEAYLEQWIRMHIRERHFAHSYRYLCLIGGRPTYTHTAVGQVVKEF